MTHPFDDFLPKSWHVSQADQRVVKFGTMLVILILVATVGAFIVSMGNLRSLAQDRMDIAKQWKDAQHRVHEYVKVQKELKDVVEKAKSIEESLDCTPRSILLWEMTQLLPEKSMLDDIRLENRRRVIKDDEVHVTEFITILGIAQYDSLISTYIESLSASPFFENVSLQYAQENRVNSQRQFAIHMEVSSGTSLAMKVSE